MTELPAARRVVVLKAKAERVAACAAGSGGAHDDGISTAICEEIDRLATDKVALRGGLAELSAENRLNEAVYCYVDEGGKAAEKRKCRFGNGR